MQHRMNDQNKIEAESPPLKRLFGIPIVVTSMNRIISEEITTMENEIETCLNTSQYQFQPRKHTIGEVNTTQHLLGPEQILLQEQLAVTTELFAYTIKTLLELDHHHLIQPKNIWFDIMEKESCIPYRQGLDEPLTGYGYRFLYVHSKGDVVLRLQNPYTPHAHSNQILSEESVLIKSKSFALYPNFLWNEISHDYDHSIIVFNAVFQTTSDPNMF